MNQHLASQALMAMSFSGSLEGQQRGQDLFLDEVADNNNNNNNTNSNSTNDNSPKTTPGKRGRKPGSGAAAANKAANKDKEQGKEKGKEKGKGKATSTSTTADMMSVLTDNPLATNTLATTTATTTTATTTATATNGHNINNSNNMSNTNRSRQSGESAVHLPVPVEFSLQNPQSTSTAAPALTEGQSIMNHFWERQMESIHALTPDSFKYPELPLSRIKKIMKTDEEVKMISAESPALFAKACELFIMELTGRSWIHTEENRRRTVQRNDIALAISKCDTYDFLIDIVPRDEIKTSRKPESSTSYLSSPSAYNTAGGSISTIADATSTNAGIPPVMMTPEQLQYYISFQQQMATQDPLVAKYQNAQAQQNQILQMQMLAHHQQQQQQQQQLQQQQQQLQQQQQRQQPFSFENTDSDSQGLSILNNSGSVSYPYYQSQGSSNRG